MRCCVLLCLLLTSALYAGPLELTPSANALNGITLLSDNPADCYLSPNLSEAGSSSYYFRPFNAPEIKAFGFCGATALGVFKFAAGTNYLSHPDYAWHNPFLNAAFDVGLLSVGATAHMNSDSVQDEDAHLDFSYDLGACIYHGDSALELKALRLDSPDKQFCISTSGSIAEAITPAISYVYEPDHKDCLRFGLKTTLHPLLALDGSWQSEPNRFGLGIALTLDAWNLYYGLRTHPELNISHGIALAWDW